MHLNITKSQSFCAITIIAINKQDHYRKICISYEPPQSILHYAILAEVCHKMCGSVSQEQGAVSFSLNWTKTFRVSGNGRWWKNDRENCLHHVYPENVFLESINCVITEFLMFKQERWNIDKCLVMFSLFILGTSSLLSVIWTEKKYIMYIIFHPLSPWCENLCKQHQCWIPQPFHRRLCCLLKPGLNHYITCNVEILTTCWA